MSECGSVPDEAPSSEPPSSHPAPPAGLSRCTSNMSVCTSASAAASDECGSARSSVRSSKLRWGEADSAPSHKSAGSPAGGRNGQEALAAASSDEPPQCRALADVGDLAKDTQDAPSQLDQSFPASAAPSRAGTSFRAAGGSCAGGSCARGGRGTESSGRTSANEDAANEDSPPTAPLPGRRGQSSRRASGASGEEDDELEAEEERACERKRACRHSMPARLTSKTVGWGAMKSARVAAHAADGDGGGADGDGTERGGSGRDRSSSTMAAAAKWKRVQSRSMSLQCVHSGARGADGEDDDGGSFSFGGGGGGGGGGEGGGGSFGRGAFADLVARASHRGGNGGAKPGMVRKQTTMSVLAQTQKEMVQQQHVVHGTRKRWWVILPTEPLLDQWMFFALCAAVAVAVAVPYRLTMHHGDGDGDDSLAMGLLGLSDVLALVTVGLNAITAHQSEFEGLIITPIPILRAYARSWALWDLVGALPLDYMSTRPELGLLRLARLRYVGSYTASLSITSKAREAANILTVMLSVSLSIHYGALFWGWINRREDARAAENGGLAGLGIDVREGACDYACLVYVGTAMLLGEPWYTQGPTSLHVTAIGVMFFGAMLFAWLFAQVIVLLASQNQCAADFQEKMRGISLSMRAQKMPQQLQNRVKRFYEFQWTLQRGANTDFLRELPDGLRVEVAVSQHRDRLKKVPIFHKCNKYVIIKLAERLTTMYAMAGDAVCVQGMVGHSMYFIERGVVTIHIRKKKEAANGGGGGADDDGAAGAPAAAARAAAAGGGREEPEEIQVGTLSVGQFFGEMALLTTRQISTIFNSARRRRATVRAKTMCTLQLLSAEDLEEVSKDEPTLLDEMVHVARQRAEAIGEDQRLAELRGNMKTNMLACRFGRRLSVARSEKAAVAEAGRRAELKAACEREVTGGLKSLLFAKRCKSRMVSRRSPAVGPEEAIPADSSPPRNGSDGGGSGGGGSRGGGGGSNGNAKGMGIAANPEAMKQFLAQRGREGAHELHEPSSDYAMLDVQLERLMMSHSEVITTVQSLAKGQEELRAELLNFIANDKN